jgi:Tol biopolymer transport system component
LHGARAWRTQAGIRLVLAAVALGVVGPLGIATLAGATPPDTTLVGAVCPPRTNTAVDAISADGRFVVAECGTARSQIYAHDRLSGQTVLASRASGAHGAMGNGDSDSASISADGRFVAFHSAASNLSPDERRRYATDIYVRNLRTNTTTLISRLNGRHGKVIDNGADAPSISANGRFVAFEAAATPGRAHGDLGKWHVLVRDLRTNTNTRVSRANGAKGAESNKDSTSPSISANGRLVAFESDATNLSSSDRNRYSDVFVRDLRAHTTTLTSRRSGKRASAGNGYSHNPVISADGRSVAFESYATNLASGGNDSGDVLVRNLQTNTTVLVNRANGADGAVGNDDEEISDYWISGDGHLVAFASKASNLTADDTGGLHNVFVRDLNAETTTLVSRATGPDGAPGNNKSAGGWLTADGATVVFESAATNLTSDEQGGGVFVRELAGGP